MNSARDFFSSTIFSLVVGRWFLHSLRDWRSLAELDAVVGSTTSFAVGPWWPSAFCSRDLLSCVTRRDLRVGDVDLQRSSFHYYITDIDFRQRTWDPPHLPSRHVSPRSGKEEYQERPRKENNSSLRRIWATRHLSTGHSRVLLNMRERVPGGCPVVYACTSLSDSNTLRIIF